MDKDKFIYFLIVFSCATILGGLSYSWGHTEGYSQGANDMQDYALQHMQTCINFVNGTVHTIYLQGDYYSCEHFALITPEIFWNNIKINPNLTKEILNE